MDSKAKENREGEAATRLPIRARRAQREGGRGGGQGDVNCRGGGSERNRKQLRNGVLPWPKLDRMREKGEKEEGMGEERW